MFVVICVHMHSFAGLIRRTPPPTFSDTAITDRHSDTTIFQLRAHWVRISWSIGSEKLFGHMPLVGVEPSGNASTLSTTPGSPLLRRNYICVYSDSRNDVPLVAQRYGTIVAHTRRRASVRCVCTVCSTCTVLPV